MNSLFAWYKELPILRFAFIKQSRKLTSMFSVINQSQVLRLITANWWLNNSSYHAKTKFINCNYWQQHVHPSIPFLFPNLQSTYRSLQALKYWPGMKLTKCPVSLDLGWTYLKWCLVDLVSVKCGMVNVAHLWFLTFTILAKRQGGPQVHKYNRVGQTMNSNFRASVRQNVRCLSLQDRQCYQRVRQWP